MWTLDKTRVNWSKWSSLTQTERSMWDAFKHEVAVNGQHPRDAAAVIRGANYKRLAGDQYQIRLSRSNRATFRVDEASETVIVLQVGGHT